MKAIDSLYYNGMDPKKLNVIDEGRVCYETQKGPNHHVTIECAISQRAYRFIEELDPPLQVGEWVTFAGTTKVNVVSRGPQPERLEVVTYCHDPYDGSKREEWVYYGECNITHLRRVAPMDIRSDLYTCMGYIRRHYDNWAYFTSSASLQETINSLEKTLEHFRYWLDRNKKEEESKNSLKLF